MEDFFCLTTAEDTVHCDGLYIYTLQGRHGGKNRKLADHMIYILRKQAANKKRDRTVNPQDFPQ